MSTDESIGDPIGESPGATPALEQASTQCESRAAGEEQETLASSQDVTTRNGKKPPENALQSTTAEDGGDQGVDMNDDNAEASITSSKSGGQGSGEGYTADCSSDASSDLSGSAKKKDKDNIILPVNDLSINDSNDDDDDDDDDDDESDDDSEQPDFSENGEADDDNHGTIKNGRNGSSKEHNNKSSNRNLKRSRKKKVRATKTSSEEKNKNGSSLASDDTDMADVDDDVILPVQLNGVQVIHPMDPRIDLSRVGYSIQRPSIEDAHADGSTAKQDLATQDDAPSLENYLQLMEVVRPFFNSHGIGDPERPPEAADSSLSNMYNEIKGRPPDAASGDAAGDSRTSTSVTGSKSSSSESLSRSRVKDAPLHMCPKEPKMPPKQAQAPLQLSARQQPLEAAADAENYAPDADPNEAADSDTSSMVVLARTKRKHKQHSSETASQQESTNSTSNVDEGAGRNRDGMDVEDDEDDRKPPARPQQADAQKGEQNQEQPEEDESGQGNASSSSSEQRLQGVAPHQPRHNYDGTHVVTESASNTNTTTSGSGSGSGSGGNSGSNQGSSGSGNGSSGSGNEGKGSSEDIGTKEEMGSGGNSNSEDVNSDNKKPDDEKEITHPVAARRHGANANAEVGANDPMKLDVPSPQPLNEPNDEAARERKLQDKKRKRMNMRREYEEKVQEELESSESSATKTAICLRPGRPITLDKVLSFTKVARMVIQAGPPFLVVHTNAAYARLTGIDAHAAVGKPISALLSVQGTDSLLTNTNPDNSAQRDNTGADNSALGLQQIDQELADSANHSPMRPYEVTAITHANVNNGQRHGQSHAEAAEAGRARASLATPNESGSVNLERLVACCGFGKYLVLHAKSRPHQMVGRNVTFISKPAESGAATHGGSSNISAASNFSEVSSNVPYDFVKCRSSISPIISDSADYGVVTDNNQDPHGHKSKRRKHHHHGPSDQQAAAAVARSGNHHHRRLHNGKDATNPKRYQECITHYVIQLELFDDSQELNGKGSTSASSTSVEANLLGLTKEEVRRQRLVARGGEHATSQEESEQRHGDDDEEMASETTENETLEAVTAVG